MDIDDQLLLAQGAGYDDSHKYGGTIVMKRLTKEEYYSYFIINCAETRERLCFNLKISVTIRINEYIKGNDYWIVHNATHIIKCTTQEEISEAINEVALEILRSEK